MNGVPDLPELLLRERAWLHALARQLVQRHEHADEVAHDALATACTQAAPLIVKPRAWLAAILTRQLAGNRRAAHRRSAREVLAARPEALPPADDTVARFEVQRDVANAVLALGEPYRTTVLLRFWDELSPAAIAKRMGVPVETVRTRLKRGLSLLRERLDRAHGGERRAWAVPLWVAARPVGSFASFLAGVTLMTAMHKVVVGGVAVAAALLFWMVSPWSSASGAVPVAPDHGPSSQVAALPAAATPVAEPAAANERVPVNNPPAEAMLVVTGTVVDDETEAAIGGVPVQLIAYPYGESLGIEATTAPDGTFALREAQLPPRAARQVVVRGSDYAAARLLVSIDPKLPRQQVDLGSIRIVRGTLFSGRVLDQEDRGVPHAALFIALESQELGGIEPQHLLAVVGKVGRADASGTFRLDQPIAPERGHRNTLFAVSPQGIGWCQFEPAKIRRDAPELVVRLRPTAAVRVVVQDPEGHPVEGAQVTALPRFGPIGLTSRGVHTPVSREPDVMAHFTGATDRAGELTLPRLPIGERSVFSQDRERERRYELAVEATGYPLQPLHACLLQAGAEQRVVVRLVQVRQLAVSVTVRDDLGAPVADAKVSVSEQQAVHGRSDREGHVELVVPATTDEVWVRAEAPGHRSMVQQLAPGPAVPVRLTLTLVRTRPLDGRVIDQLGEPVAGMVIAIDGQHLGTTNGEGRFHLDACPMGVRKVDVALASGMDPSRWTGEQMPTVVDAEAGPVTITMQRRVGNVDVQVAIVDAANGQALDPTEVNLALFTEDAGGGFVQQKAAELKRGLVVAKSCVAARWRLCVRTADDRRGSLLFQVVDGQLPLNLRLELKAPGAVRGRLQFVDVAPPPNVTLDLRHATIEAGMGSRFRFPGRWHVDAGSQSVTGDQHGWTGSLRMQPAQDLTFRVDSADPIDELVFTVIGEGVAGEARVRVAPGQTRDVVVEVRAKALPR